MVEISSLVSNEDSRNDRRGYTMATNGKPLKLRDSIPLAVIIVALSAGCLAGTWASAAAPRNRAALARQRAAMQARRTGPPKKSSAPPPIRLPEAVVEKPRKPAVKVAGIDRSTTTTKAVADAAAAIDAILASEWSAAGMSAGEPLSDEQFVRRAYLELGGRIPRLDEAERFLRRRGADKRDDLIADLLESPDYVSHFYNFWADILRLKERPDKRTLVFEPYMDWVKQSIAANTPYDEWVFAMLTADGTLWDNPAVGYQLRDRGMPLPYVDNTVRVFLGTQIGCAQCHDHPFDRWTQKQFYELAALTSGTRDRLGQRRAGGGSQMQMMMGMQETAENTRALFKELREARQNREVPVAAIQFLRLNTTAVSFHDTPLKLPHDYKYDNGAPAQRVEPAVLWGSVPDGYAAADGRTQFAGWLTSRDNRQFARAIANRLWKKMMGVGVVEPVDDFQEGNVPVSEQLLEQLTDTILQLDFDLRAFLRVIASTKAWQSQAVVHDPTADTPHLFIGPALKRMSAEQLWDSILMLVARNEWAFQRPTAGEIADAVAVDLGSVSYDEFVDAWREFEQQYGRGYQRQLRSIAGYKDQVLVRASELPMPLPADHFLSQFGIGDRDSIQSGRQAATVPQVLTMFNGWTTHTMLERGSVIYDNVVKQTTPRTAIDTIFLSILSRRPTGGERTLAVHEVKTAETPAAGCGNLIWALLNTREFLFIQ